MELGFDVVLEPGQVGGDTFGGLLAYDCSEEPFEGSGSKLDGEGLFHLGGAYPVCAEPESTLADLDRACIPELIVEGVPVAPAANTPRGSPPVRTGGCLERGRAPGNRRACQMLCVSGVA